MIPRRLPSPAIPVLGCDGSCGGRLSIGSVCFEGCPRHRKAEHEREPAKLTAKTKVVVAEIKNRWWRPSSVVLQTAEGKQIELVAGDSLEVSAWGYAPTDAQIKTCVELGVRPLLADKDASDYITVDLPGLRGLISPDGRVVTF